jgi:hypothetical protein
LCPLDVKEEKRCQKMNSPDVKAVDAKFRLKKAM